MAFTPKELLNQLMQTEGAMCAALVDYNSGMLLESVGTGLDLELAAAGNTEVVRAKMKTMKSKQGMTDSQMAKVLSQNPDLLEQLKNAPRCKGLAAYVSHIGSNGSIINLVYKNTDGQLRFQMHLCGVLF